MKGARTHRAALAFAVLVGSLSCAQTSFAAPDTPDKPDPPAKPDTPDVPPSEEVGGVVRPASPPGESGRAFLDALLWLPRTLVQIVVVASTATVSFFEDQQVVPRARALLGSEDGTVRVAPTISLASGLRPEVGARMTSRVGSFGSMLRVSIIDPDYYTTEARLLKSFGEQSQSQLVLEGYQQRRSGQGFDGLGQNPRTDPRNVFVPGREGDTGTFLENRQRLIVAFASRFHEDYELLLSTSYQRRTLENSPDSAGETIADVFAPGSAPGANDRSERTYSEVALRRDTRAVRGPPAAGLLLEAYGGSSQDVNGKYAPALHAGGRAAWFVSVVRKTSILNPRVTLDVVEPLGDRALPFREYAYASGFRGVGGRIDRVAALASLDYRWQLREYVAARLFADVTTVARQVSELDVTDLSWAVGGGLDLHSSTTELGRLGLAYSSDGVQIILVFGLADPGFGDRQHR